MDSTDASGKEVADLQFDHADHADGEQPSAGSGEGTVQCASCFVDVDAYYAVGEATLCAGCKDEVEAELEARTQPGRFLRALLYGLPAAMVGSAIYYAIVAVTDYEIGLVAILIGFMVGAAVRAGSGPGGGRRYQLLAAVMTYCAIVTTYVPFVLEGLEQAAAEETEMATVDGSTETVPDVADAEALPPPSAGEFVVAVAIIAAIAFAAPFLAGFENIIGLLIIGFGVYQAWKMNQRVQVEITGPHVVGPQLAETT